MLALRGLLPKSPSRARRDVSKAFEAAMNWLARHGERFSLEVQNREFAGKTVEMPWRIKPLGELILLVRVLERHGIEGAALATLRAAALDYAREFDWHLLGAFDASAASPLAMVLEFFEAHGVEGTLERDYVSQLSSFGYFEGMDRIPYRSMDRSSSSYWPLMPSMSWPRWRWASKISAPSGSSRCSSSS